MEQDRRITSSTHHDEPEPALTAHQRLQRRIALLNAPLQVNALTSSEDNFLSSLTAAERNYAETVMDHIDLHVHSMIDDDGLREELDNADYDAVHYDHIQDDRRRHYIERRAIVYGREAHFIENVAAQLAFRDALTVLVKKFKRHAKLHETDWFSASTTGFKYMCFSELRAGQTKTLTLAQARKITFSVARKCKFHSSKQLWRYVKTDHAMVELAQWRAMYPND
jgi:hypothetical protein